MAEIIGKASESTLKSSVVETEKNEVNLTPEQQEKKEQIDKLVKKLEAINLQKEYFEKYKTILSKKLLPEDYKDQDAQDTILLLKSIIKRFDASEMTSQELNEEITRMTDNLEFSLGGEVNDEGKLTENIFSQEKLKTITNKEFLSVPKEQRLQYITTNHIDSENVANGTINNLEFSFTTEGVYNKELWSRTTAGQVLPIEVQSVKIGEMVYSRTGLDGEFFNTSNNRLVIHEGTNIITQNLRTQDEIKTIVADNKEKLNEYKDPNDLAIASEAVKRGIDPEFAIYAFGETYDSIGDSSDAIVLEDMFTEFDRLRGGLAIGNELKDGKYDNLLVLLVLKKFNKTNWKILAKDYGVESDIVDDFNSSENIPRYLSLGSRQEIISRCPDYIKKTIGRYFPINEVENAILVSHGESGWDIGARRDASKNPGGGNDLGLFQINDKYHPEKVSGRDMFDIDTNVQAAYKVFKEANNTWRPWYAARKIGLA